MGDGSNTSNAFLRNLSQKKYSWMQPSSILSPSPGKGAATPPQISSSISSNNIPAAAANRSQSANNGEASSKEMKRQPSEDSTRSTKRARRQDPLTKKVTSRKNSPLPKLASRSSASPSPAPSIDLENQQQVRRRAKRHQQPRFKYSTFNVKGYNILPVRNILSGFDKSDVSYMPGNKAGSQGIIPDPEEEWHDTIIIHPGSRYLRIGRSSDAFPSTVPHVIAREIQTSNIPETDNSTAQDVNEVAATVSANQSSLADESDVHRTAVDANSLNYNRDEALREIKNELKWRMKAAKRRAVPNAESQVVGFNSLAYKETIPDHNDPYRVEWTEVNASSPTYFVGEKALNLPISKYPQYRLSYPWKHGTLNCQDYDSVEAVLGDLQTIWTDTIRSELKVEDTNFEKYNAVVVVPDQMNRRYISDILTLLLRHMKFRAVSVQQDSVCATYGAGMSGACVVDIGAQKTSIACIEEGVILPDSKLFISIGGDDITRTFASFLLANKFPYADINLSRAYDWRLAQELKEKWCTMNEADISVQVYDFFVRLPGDSTKKYQCKVYDEVFLAPLCLVYPSILNAKEKTENFKAFANPNVIDDVADDSQTSQSTVPTIWQQEQKELTEAMSESPEMPTEKGSVYDVYPIDVAIARCIQAASGPSDERLKRFFTSIILVGGGGMISNFNRVLEDRILSTVIAQQAAIEKVEVLPAPRELDPRLLVWKGASVFSKLETAKEMWIGQKEWDEIGVRCLRDRAMIM
ncbi:hypothetical protein VTP01DRAFT_4605 [Rhizomucor pusillus]|uniref:uncharacterized protein n=1 Tax=Rhizomucor pusillus TaxID=4840 RepID=UPI003742D05F